MPGPGAMADTWRRSARVATASTAPTTASPRSSAGAPTASPRRSSSIARANAPTRSWCPWSSPSTTPKSARSPPTTPRCPTRRKSRSSCNLDLHCIIADVRRSLSRAQSPLTPLLLLGRGGRGHGSGEHVGGDGFVPADALLIVLLAHVGGLALLRHEPTG